MIISNLDQNLNYYFIFTDLKYYCYVLQYFKGAEMDKILKEEGVLDQEDIAAEPAVVEEKVDIIGRIETENGDVLGEPVFTYKPRFHSRYCKYFKYRAWIN